MIVDETAQRIVFVSWHDDVPVPMSFPLDFEQFLKDVGQTAFGKGMISPIVEGVERA